LDGGNGVRQRLNTGGVHRANLLNDAKKIVDFAEHARLFVGLELKPGQVGNSADVLWVQGHTFIKEEACGLQAMRLLSNQ
jgi:hypothetical protein